MPVANQPMKDIEAVFEEGLKLPQPERLVLAQQLINSCTPDEPQPLNRHQLEELLNARIKAVEEGRLATYDASESLARVRAMLAQRQR
jgi:hypothetical protein